MKRIAIIICALAAICMTACAQQKQKEHKKAKTLVAYFSASGVTKVAAEKLAEVTGGDIYEIQPKVPYTDADLDWHNKKSRSSVEMADPASRPAIKGKVEKLNDYNTVFIGYPIWWNTAPTIINTFIEANNLKGKKVVPFCTSGSSSIKKSAEDLKKAYPILKWREGKRLNGISKKELQSWIKGL
ncbi:MAG: NAD(P)H-dependent oxidoreductase [Prevotella sp.]|nr:NAD(P)H-dependent oxidoreductase [Prevotella sp.]